MDLIQLAPMTPKMIQLTEAAQIAAKDLLAKEEGPSSGLRVAVVGGGCSGLSYKLGFDTPSEADETHEYDNGLIVMVDDKSIEHLKGSTLEYHNTIDRSGFEVVNPNATRSCGCGNSFSSG